MFVLIDQERLLGLILSKDNKTYVVSNIGTSQDGKEILIHLAKAGSVHSLRIKTLRELVAERYCVEENVSLKEWLKQQADKIAEWLKNNQEIFGESVHVSEDIVRKCAISPWIKLDILRLDPNCDLQAVLEQDRMLWQIPGKIWNRRENLKINPQPSPLGFIVEWRQKAMERLVLEKLGSKVSLENCLAQALMIYWYKACHIWSAFWGNTESPEIRVETSVATLENIKDTEANKAEIVFSGQLEKLMYMTFHISCRQRDAQFRVQIVLHFGRNDADDGDIWNKMNRHISMYLNDICSVLV